MLQNSRVTVFTISELLRENQQGKGGGRGKGGWEVKLLPVTQIRIKMLTDLLTIKKKPKLIKFSFMVIQLYSVNDKLILDASIKYNLEETKQFLR